MDIVLLFINMVCWGVIVLLLCVLICGMVCWGVFLCSGVHTFDMCFACVLCGVSCCVVIFVVLLFALSGFLCMVHWCFDLVAVF